ncbi:MAG: GNAT family N-acetyltransferase [Clostridiales bacterium]|nr:GNAT family N-acetyltransferase [Clostridiales bacterium]
MVINNLVIRNFKADDLHDFTKMFTTYFRSDFNIDISDDGANRLCKKMAEDILSGIVNLDLLIVDGKSIGFINAQIDTPKSDWCEREGWGFIREMYIHKDYRGRGFGSKLVKHVEETFYTIGVRQIYLTSDETGDFWISCGYKESGEISSINNGPIYEK